MENSADVQTTDYSYLIGSGEIHLSDQQNRAIDRMIRHRSITLAFQPGLGKTLTSLTAATWFVKKYPDKAVCLIMSPRSARNAFVKELSKKFNVEYAIYTADYIVEYDGTQKYVLIEHSVMDRYMDVVAELFAKKNVVGIVDEAHFSQGFEFEADEAVRGNQEKILGSLSSDGDPVGK